MLFYFLKLILTREDKEMSLLSIAPYPTPS